MPSQLNTETPASLLPKSSSRTTWPASSIILTLTLSAACGKSRPPTAMPPPSATKLPGARTLCPIIPTAWNACVWVKAFNVALSFSMPLTVLNCAICEVICALSSGLSGSWFFICVTRSLRNLSSCSCAAVLVAGVVFCAVSVTPSTATVMISYLQLLAQGLLTQSQCALNHRLGRIHHFHAGLIGARSGNHVGHFFHHVDVRHRDVALLVGIRALGVVDQLHRGRIVHHLRHHHTRRTLGHGSIKRLGLKHYLPGAIRLSIRTGHAIGVCHVARHHVKPHGLCRHGRTGNIEYVKQAHQLPPRNASIVL